MEEKETILDVNNINKSAVQTSSNKFDKFGFEDKVNKSLEINNNFADSSNYLNLENNKIFSKSNSFSKEKDKNTDEESFEKTHNSESTKTNFKIKQDNFMFREVNENEVLEYNNPLNQNNIEDKENFIIQIRNIHKTYLIGMEGVPALRGVSLNIKESEFLIILGTSGGGKTTLLNTLGTIDTPSRGDVKLLDYNLKSNTKDDILSLIRLKEIAFVFQSFNLLSNLNVVENVELPMKILGEMSSDEIRERAKYLITEVGLEHRLWHFPNQLSGGEQQRVTIARALANNPKILLLDEPTGDLDTKNSDKIMNLLLDLNITKKITMIMVTHDISLKHYGNRVVRVMDGKIQNSYDIDIEDRNKHIQALKERINSTNNLREGGENHMQGSNTNTFIRSLNDYKIISKRKKEMKM